MVNPELYAVFYMISRGVKWSSYLFDSCCWSRESIGCLLISFSTLSIISTSFKQDVSQQPKFQKKIIVYCYQSYIGRWAATGLEYIRNEHFVVLEQSF